MRPISVSIALSALLLAGTAALAQAPSCRRDVTLLATGSEVGIAIDARELLAK